MHKIQNKLNKKSFVSDIHHPLIPKFVYCKHFFFQIKKNK